MLDRLFLFIALLFSAVAALAQDSGFYLGGALGQARFKEWCDIPLASCKDTDTAWKLLGGYRFNRYVAAEGTYADWGEVSAANSTGVRAEASQNSYGLAVVGTLPLNERFELFGKAGFLMTSQETRRVGATTSSVSRDETELHYGLGGRLLFTRNLGLRGEWENTDKLKVEMLSIGLEYRF